MSLQLAPNQVGLPQGQPGQQVQYNGDQVGYWQSGFYVEHVATGLWFLANYGEEFVQSSGPYKDRPDHWYLKAGLRERWVSLGHTVPYGFYGQRNNMFDSGLVSGATGMFNHDCEADTDCTVFKSRTTEWGGGIVQEIDAAAMSVWIQAEQFSAGATACAEGIANGVCIVVAGEATTVHSDLKDMTVVKFGGLINF